MMRAHFTAFKLLLLAISILSNKVFTNVRITNGTPVRANYVVVKPDGPNELDDNRLTAPQDVDSDARYRYDVRIVAVDADGMLLLADAVMSIVKKSVVVAGRNCSPIRLVPGVEEKAQYDATTDLHYLDLTFEFWSRRA